MTDRINGHIALFFKTDKTDKTFARSRPIGVRDHLNGHNSLNGHICLFFKTDKTDKTFARSRSIVVP